MMYYNVALTTILYTHIYNLHCGPQVGILFIYYLLIVTLIRAKSTEDIIYNKKYKISEQTTVFFKLTTTYNQR
jgi:hypothetical protein